MPKQGFNVCVIDLEPARVEESDLLADIEAYIQDTLKSK